MNLKSVREQIVLLDSRGLTSKQIQIKLAHLNVGPKLIYRTLKRKRTTGSCQPPTKRARKRVKRTPEVIKCVREQIRRNPQRSTRQMAKDFNMAQTSMRKIIRDDLKMRCYKKQVVHGLTEKNKKDRVTRCKTILQRHATCKIIFSDEKMFTLQASINKQNDRVYGISLQDIPVNFRAVERYQNASSVMVWGAISEEGKLPLVFIEPGVKVNKEYYIHDVLVPHLLPEARKLFGGEDFCFQQDSAPAHKALLTQNWCQCNLPHFISSQEWPASSPDLNPLDFSIWGYMLQRLNVKKDVTKTTFKQILMEIWKEIPNEVVRAACGDFKKRLKLSIKHKGERLELFQ